jgi:acyl dehydratase
MPIPVGGARHGPFPGCLDPGRIAAYAAVTGDATPAVLRGEAIPAVFPVLLVLDAQAATHADLPAQAWQQARGGLHGEHDIVLHRPLVPGEILETWAQLSAVRTVRAGVQVVAHLEQLDAAGLIAVEQWWTMVLLGVTSLADFGMPPADHRFPDSARGHPLGSQVHHIDEQAARRYAEVSGDWADHHFHIDAARASGADFVFTHGLFTMAACAHGVQRLIGLTDPGRVSRVAVRFAAPTPLGADLVVETYAVETNSFAFEATADGVRTISHGRLELRP